MYFGKYELMRRFYENSKLNKNEIQHMYVHTPK